MKIFGREREENQVKILPVNQVGREGGFTATTKKNLFHYTHRFLFDM